MRKISVLILLLISVMFLLISSGVFGSPIVYPPASIPFPYDANSIIDGIIGVDPNGDYIWGPHLLGGIDVRAGVEVIVPIDVNDPDDDPFSVRVLNWQAGMNFTVGDANTSSLLKWKPANGQAGLHYINIESWDFPPDPNGVPSLNDSLFDRGTLVFLVRPRNRPPRLLPLGE